MLNLLTVFIPKYGLTHILVVLFFPLLAIVSYFIFKKKSEKSKVIYLYILMAIAFIGTWLTFFTALAQDYNHQRANFFARLPLHMCSINVILYPLFFFLRNKVKPLIRSTLFAYMYFFGSAGALLAMVVTAPGDCIGANINFFQYNVFMYWLKHGLIFILPILFVVLGFYKPTIKDIFKSVVFIIILLCIMECVNLLFTYLNQHVTHGTDIANFFYTRTGKGTAVLEAFYNFLPYELLYMFPLVIIAVPIFFIYYLPFFIFNLIQKKQLKKKNISV